ncbi:short chain dehydrogenase/reductase [Penicillium atrosanguineum]|uniref:Short chain dehydrogenase/reductase n=1 Tax=Penicillium atrosanguineum TaxID=1132637 RepID=A0A9W9QBW5_9EURO|nr:short chain dehydrogenase/reductase [Penicillium atrosanguineum]KAJ5330811.1 short chain dehydrogenase/reductase [Penicillium atrosanguineum]
MAPTNVLITGANSGLGLAIAKVLVRASENFHVILASRSRDKAQAALDEIEAGGPKGSVSILQLDVTNEESINEATGYVQEHFGYLDVLINNAAVGCLDVDDVKTRFQCCLETNVLGPAMVSAAFRHLLLKSANPYSIFVGTGARSLPRNAIQQPPSHFNHIRNGDAYQVSKAALNMLAVLEARDYGPQGIKVFVLSPGLFRSNLRGTSEEAKSGWGKAEDPEGAAEVVLSILQGNRDSEVGQLIHKDGVYEW